MRRHREEERRLLAIEDCIALAGRMAVELDALDAINEIEQARVGLTLMNAAMARRLELCQRECAKLIEALPSLTRYEYRREA